MAVRDFHHAQMCIRDSTYWTHSDQDTLRTLRVGDTITSSLNGSRSVRVAGIQWGRNFALRPDLVTFPVSSLSASSVVPSSVSLYVNGVQQYSGNVPAGPFVVNQIPGVTGSGQATLVTRDALGRSVSTSVPLYIDTRMLAAGLSSYSIEVGVARRQFSVRSFDYDKRPAVTASGRYGLDDALTLEGHTEMSAGVYNVGAGALVRLGQAGVVNGALSGSAGHYNGGQVSLGLALIHIYRCIRDRRCRARWCCRTRPAWASRWTTPWCGSSWCSRSTAWRAAARASAARSSTA